MTEKGSKIGPNNKKVHTNGIFFNREKNDSFNIFIENYPDAVLVLDLNFIIINYSQTVLKILGYVKNDDLLSKNFLEFFRIKDKNIFIHDIKTAENKLAQNDYKMLNKNGTLLRCEIKTSCIPNFKNPKFYIVMIRDYKIINNLQNNLKSSEKLLLETEKISSLGHWDYEIKSRKVTWSDEIYKLFERDKKLGPLKFDEYEQYYDSEDYKMVCVKTKEASLTGKEFEIVSRIILPRGKIVYYRTIIKTLKNKKGIVEKLYGTIQDITDIKLKELDIKKAIVNKDFIIKESRHRIKNNLQLITSLIELQSRQFQDEKTVDIFKDIVNRIKLISILFEDLFLEKDINKINFDKYITQITNNLYEIYSINRNDVKLNINIPKMFVDNYFTIQIGMIINELVSNSLKYAFPNNRKGEININLILKDKYATFEISDNGVGISKNINVYQTKTLGLQLVYMLIKQLNGKIAYDDTLGTKFVLTLPNKNMVAINEKK